MGFQRNDSEDNSENSSYGGNGIGLIRKYSAMSRSSIDTFDPRGLMQREEPATSLHGGGEGYISTGQTNKGSSVEASGGISADE